MSLLLLFGGTAVPLPPTPSGNAWDGLNAASEDFDGLNRATVDSSAPQAASSDWDKTGDA